MRYFEFNRTDYYALISVKPSKVDTMIKAMKVYVEYVSYDSVDELRIEGLHPDEVTKEQAMLKFFLAPGSEDTPIGVLKQQFDECVDSVLLIDQSLL